MRANLDIFECYLSMLAMCKQCRLNRQFLGNRSLPLKRNLLLHSLLCSRYLHGRSRLSCRNHRSICWQGLLGDLHAIYLELRCKRLKILSNDRCGCFLQCRNACRRYQILLPMMQSMQLRIALGSTCGLYVVPRQKGLPKRRFSCLLFSIYFLRMLVFLLHCCFRLYSLACQKVWLQVGDFRPNLRLAYESILCCTSLSNLNDWHKTHRSSMFLCVRLLALRLVLFWRSLIELHLVV